MSTQNHSSSASASVPHLGPPPIDAHHHLWQDRASEFEWIDESMAELRRDFLVQDLQRAMRTANIDASIAVQARRTLDETHWLLESIFSGTPARIYNAALVSRPQTRGNREYRRQQSPTHPY